MLVASGTSLQRQAWTKSSVCTSDEGIRYPGSPGYKLLGECTREEYERYRNARRSQARGVIAKIIRTDRLFSRRAPVGL